MIRLMTIFAGAGTALAASAILGSAPAVAQSSPLAEIIVYGTDPCPRTTDDEVVICKRRPESERYRISPKLRSSGPRQTRESWARKVEDLKNLGATGINSCSPVGPGGFTGCMAQEIDRGRKERDEEDAAQDPDL